jgi:hypothetical protein
MRWSWTVGVTHAEINNVFAAPTRSHFQFSSDIKNIRRETINTRKTAFGTEFSHRFLRFTLAPGPSERRCHDVACLENNLKKLCCREGNEKSHRVKTGIVLSKSGSLLRQTLFLYYLLNTMISKTLLIISTVIENQVYSTRHK